MPSSYTLPKGSRSAPDLAVRHLGIITSRVLYWYRFLPPSMRDGYDVEDMIGDVVLHVVAQSQKYNASKSKECTWVWWVAERCCMSIWGHCQAKRRTGLMEDLDTAKGVSVLGTEKRCASFDAIERVIQSGSDLVADFIESLLNGSAATESRFRRVRQGLWVSMGERAVFFDDKGVLGAGTPDLLNLIKELRQTFQRCGASVEDLRTVLHYAS